MRILLIGPGVNGSVCAAYLKNSGFDITVLARGERLKVLTRDGIIIESPYSGKRTTAKVKVIATLEPQDKYDYILIVVRNNQIGAILPALKVNVSPNLVFMGNNLAGPDEIIKVLGKERVMMGFVFGGGKRDGDIVRGIISGSLRTPFGEIDGQVTPRLQELVNIFNKTGLKAEISHNIVDYLATHAIGVPVIGLLVMKYHNDIKAQARSSEDMDLLAKAYKETFKVLKATGHKVIPRSQAFMALMPAWLNKLIFGTMLNSKLGEVGLAWHVSQAPDEMHKLATDLQAMVERSGLAVPDLRELLKLNETLP